MGDDYHPEMDNNTHSFYIFPFKQLCRENRWCLASGVCLRGAAGGGGAPKRIEAKHNEFIRDKERSRDRERERELNLSSAFINTSKMF